MKAYLILILFSFPFFAKAELVCSEGTGFQYCDQQSSADPSTCQQSQSPIIEHTGQNSQPMSCSSENLAGNGTSKKDVDAERKEYEKLCKKKAKSYKRALMKNLMSKGKVGQWLQVLFHKKKYKSKVSSLKSADKNQSIDIDPDQFKNMTPEQVEDHILSELEEKLKMPGLKSRAKEVAKDPAFQYSYDRPETVPLNLMVKTKKNATCKVDVEGLPKETSFKAKDCKFCEEKNITGSFTNDCSYMVNSQHSESEAHALIGVKKREDYCNHSMDGEQNDLREVDAMADTLCEMAHEGNLKPDFTIETSRNLYRDKTPQLAKKRGEYIQKYLRKNLIDKCFEGDLENAPDWLKDENDFNHSVKVTHPYYEKAAEGDYGPSPYAKGADEQSENIKNLELTLKKEKVQLQSKFKMASDAKKLEAERLIKIDKDLKTLTLEYQKESKELAAIKSLDDQFFIKKKHLEDAYNEVRDYQELKNLQKQKMSDLDKEIGGYDKKLSTIDQENTSKVTLLKEYYEDLNVNGEKLDKKAWDEKLFNGFKMVRITGKGIEDHDIGIAPEHMTPAVKVALNALVDVQDFTCVVEPIKTHKTKIGNILRGVGKVGMAITLPVVAAGGLVVGLATSPLSWAGSYMCEGCGEPGNVPPILTFNPRFWSLKAPFKKETWSDVGDGISSYVTLGGRLDADFNLKKDYFENSVEDVKKDENKRLGR